MVMLLWLNTSADDVGVTLLPLGLWQGGMSGLGWHSFVLLIDSHYKAVQ
jgi:hypothetical protein